MGWRLVEVEREDAITDVEPDPIPANLDPRINEEAIKFPDWYTEQDREVGMVSKGICNNCFHLRLLFSNSDNYELSESWCSALKQRLEQKINNCDAFYAYGDEIERLMKGS